MKSPHKTVGSQVQELLTKTPDSRNPLEIARKMKEKYIPNLIECVEKYRKIFPGDFYVEVLTKFEVALLIAFRDYFEARLSCPTPNYDQSVYKYNAKEERIEWIWTIPDRDTCYHLLINKHLVVKEEQQLLQQVLDLESGALFRKMKELNGEELESPHLRQD